MKIFLNINKFLLISLLLAGTASAQTFERGIDASQNSEIRITNFYGRVSLIAEKDRERSVLQVAGGIESEVLSLFEKNRYEITVAPADAKKRIDVSLKLPARMRIRVETGDGEVRVEGEFESVAVKTDTGTIVADVPLADLKYDFVWTSSRPRFMSDVRLEEVKEKAAGRFVVKGRFQEEAGKSDKGVRSAGTDGIDSAEEQLSGPVKLEFTTARGIILLNVNPGSVPSDLRERALTEAAKAIIRSGDSILMNAIRRASPKYFGDYASTLPPFRSAPVLEEGASRPGFTNARIKRILVKVTDFNNRSLPDLTKSDFELTERGQGREILSVEPAVTPFNLVLLVDVSGSVDNYVNFIRKAARNFVDTVSPTDRVAIIIFNDDIEVLSNFTTDKVKLSESLDSFDAGGGTAFYDALAYTLAETLRPLKGERTGIIVLSDGEDTRSFLSFDSILGAIQESGALIYPLYVPNGLIAASRDQDPNATIDPLRTRYIGLTSKAEAEGEKLAQISGGVYYPIRQLDELQQAYDDIVVQLRTAYSITFRSDLVEMRDGGISPRLRVRVKRENAFVKLGSVVEVAQTENE